MRGSFATAALERAHLYVSERRRNACAISAGRIVLHELRYFPEYDVLRRLVASECAAAVRAVHIARRMIARWRRERHLRSVSMLEEMARRALVELLRERPMDDENVARVG